MTSNSEIWPLGIFTESIAAVNDSGQTLTYAELKSQGDELAKAVGDRCLVFQLCSNTFGGLTGYIGFLSNGIVPAMLRSDIPQILLSDLCKIYHPAYLWMPVKEKTRLGIDLKPVYESMYYALIPTDYGKTTRLNPELALLLTTSGTTGSPKFVRQTYDNIAANTKSIIEYLHLDRNQKAITSLPMQYTYGLSIINTHIAVGAQLLMTDKSIMQREFWDFFRQYGATSLAGVPYTYEMLNWLHFERMDLPSLRSMTQAGGKLLPELHKKFAQYSQDTGREFIVMYGACEATARMGWLPPQESLIKVGSMGKAIPGGRFELIDADGKVITEPGKVGELVYYGANVTMGYAECGIDLSKGDERQARYETGDMAECDVDGFYTIVGRKKRFLKIFGNRVNLDDAERLVKTKFATADVACGGVDDKLYIFAVNKDLLPAMKKFLADETGLNASAFKIVKLSEIPHNTAGKTLYRELTKYY